MTLDRVRFSLGPDVFQGFTDGVRRGMVGHSVWVTASTLAEVAALLDSQMTTDFDRQHNRPEAELDMLAFGSPHGDTARLAPDGVTPVYLLSVEPGIVQRWDPSGGRTFDRIEDGVTYKVPYGAWVNEESLDGFYGGQDWTPILHGFVIQEDEEQIVVEGSEPSVRVARVTIEYTNGGESFIDFDTVESNQSGSTYTSPDDIDITQEQRILEDAISTAVTKMGLWP